MTSEQELQKMANKVARQHGCGKADRILWGDRTTVIEHVRCGYRKYTTGEYVPQAYLNNFGWKNTYYQHAHTTVMLAI
jgi:hypothetical protein